MLYITDIAGPMPSTLKLRGKTLDVILFIYQIISQPTSAVSAAHTACKEQSVFSLRKFSLPQAETSAWKRFFFPYCSHSVNGVGWDVLDELFTKGADHSLTAFRLC